MRSAICLLLMSVAATAAVSQIRVLSVEQLPLPSGRTWSAPQFAPDGTTIFLSSSGYRGIWEYRPAGGTLRQITDDAGAGFGFAVSPDGSRLAYRKTTLGVNAFDRTQEIVEVNLRSAIPTSVARGRDVSVPAWYGERVIHQQSEGIGSLPAPQEPAARNVVLGIEGTKIAMVRDGMKVLLDPYGGGSYIWPSLSPDGTRLLAYEMSRGTFVCDVQGNVLVTYGRRDAPAWTRSGKWIVFMDQKDDGQTILSSDLYAVSVDGATTVRLTDTPAIALMPACSPTSDTIVCCTPTGEVYLLTYEEEGR